VAHLDVPVALGEVADDRLPLGIGAHRRRPHRRLQIGVAHGDARTGHRLAGLVLHLDADGSRAVPGVRRRLSARRAADRSKR
jgi:hypothetical protein